MAVRTSNTNPGDLQPVVAPTYYQRLADVEAQMTGAKDSTVIDGINTQLAEMVQVQGESATLGSELTSSTGWTSTGWTGDYNTGFTNTAGNTQPLVFPLPNTGTSLYQVSLTLSNTGQQNGGNGTSDFTIQIGNSDTFVTYQGPQSSFTYTYGIQSLSNGNLVITPSAGYTGTVTNISVKQIISPTNPTNVIKDSTGNNALEMRPTTNALNNIFIGKKSGRYNTTGHENVSVGDNNMSSNTTGFWNTAVGKDTLSNNTVGSRNVALGYLALNANTTGHRNVAAGPFALTRNTDGANNIALGADSLWYNTTGYENIGIGLATLSANTTGNDNIGIGTASLTNNTTGQYNIAIGLNALINAVSANNNIAIGYNSLFYATSTPNTAIGTMSQYHNTTGTNNVTLGDSALYQNTTGIRNTVLGSNAGFGGGGAINRNTLIGYNAGSSLTTGGDQNTIVGASSGASLTTGAGNILIGYNIQATTATTNNSLNIGNKIYGDVSVNGHIGIGEVNPGADSASLFTTQLKLQIGTATKAGEIDLAMGTNTDDTPVGIYSFINKNNLDSSGGTRKVLGYIQGSAKTSNSNASGDSGGRIKVFIKKESAGLIEAMRQTSVGTYIGNGVYMADPTAYLHLGQGTSAAGTAPLKLTAGTLMATPETGAIEFDGTNLYITISGVRKTIQVA